MRNHLAFNERNTLYKGLLVIQQRLQIKTTRRTQPPKYLILKSRRLTERNREKRG
uniref:Uncharacterized protein n=1 Tax=Rhizophora mucronata TaxID=61149 RepID=A0A2P2M7D9_RHIMU